MLLCLFLLGQACHYNMRRVRWAYSEWLRNVTSTTSPNYLFSGRRATNRNVILARCCRCCQTLMNHCHWDAWLDYISTEPFIVLKLVVLQNCMTVIENNEHNVSSDICIDLTSRHIVSLRIAGQKALYCHRLSIIRGLPQPLIHSVQLT